MCLASNVTSGAFQSYPCRCEYLMSSNQLSRLCHCYVVSRISSTRLGVCTIAVAHSNLCHSRASLVLLAFPPRFSSHFWTSNNFAHIFSCFKRCACQFIRSTYPHGSLGHPLRHVPYLCANCEFGNFSLFWDMLTSSVLAVIFMPIRTLRACIHVPNASVVCPCLFGSSGRDFPLPPGEYRLRTTLVSRFVSVLHCYAYTEHWRAVSAAMLCAPVRMVGASATTNR